MIKGFSKLLFIFAFVLFYSISTLAQSGMNFQGVARNSNNVILASQPISLRLSVLKGTTTGNIEYQETKTINTNAQGLFNLVIGDGTAISSMGTYSNINWQESPKFIKIEMDANAGNNFITLGTTQLQYVAYAYFANGVAAENIVGLVPVARGGTGSSTLLDLKNNLQLDKVNNTADSLKPLSKAVALAMLAKLNNNDTVNLSNRINNKLNYADTVSLSNRIDLKINLTDGLNALALKADATELNTGLSSKVDKVTGKGLSTNDYTTVEKTKLAAITGTNTGDQDLSSYATNTALALKANSADVNTGLGLKANASEINTALLLKANASDVTTSLALKEDASNKSSASDLGGVSPSDLLYPTQKAVKDYVTANAASSGVADGGITTIKLAELVVTDAKLASGINKSKVGLSNVENTALSTWAGSNNLTTVGTITSGTWSGTAISLNNGGTGATNAEAARANLGLVIGTNVQAPLVAGTDYQIPLTAGTSYIVPNSSITAKTKIKITYDSKGLITAGSDATTADIAPSTDRNYVTDVQSGVISNTSGINTGDETTSTIKSKLGITTLSGSNTGDQTNVTGNAGTATKLATARKINNVDFDGSGDIIITAIAEAGTLTGTTLNATVTGSSLTSVGTLANLTVINPIVGSITGNAATAGNITATSNTTLTSLSNLNTVGTITSGVWSGTTVAVEKGGTGLTSAGTAGQVLTSTGRGTLVWQSTTTALSIGDVYQGGIVAYILQAGDPGYDATIQKGIIAASSDQSTGIRWYNGNNTTTGASGTAIGTGLSNTNTIITSQGAISTSYAAGLARAYTGGGYTDWYLPSKDELNKLYLNRTAIGGFAIGSNYWSSTEGNANLVGVSSGAWFQSFYDGYQGDFFKSYAFAVRAIRAFSAVKSIEDGGTGATTASAARTNLGLEIGTNVQALLTAGTDYLAPNTSITGATKTKITYDTKGLITAGADATTADIEPSTNRNYITDVQAGVISNTSGVNTGDETTSSLKSKLGITTLSGSNTGDQVLPTLLSLGAVPTSRVITINGTGLDLSSDRSFTINTGLTLADLESSNVKAKTFELTQPTAINSTTTTTLDLSIGNLLELVLTGPTTLAFSNPKIGTYIIKIKQDGTGGRTLTFPIMKWADAAVPTITTAANAIDLITLIYDGTHYYGSCLQNF